MFLATLASVTRRTAPAAVDTSHRVGLTTCIAAACLLGPTLAAAQLPSTAAFDPAAPVAVVVKVPTPWYAPQALVKRRMREAVPQYEALPGLVFKAFSFARADGHFGGVYLWSDAAAAAAHFDASWFARVQRERGTAADVRLFEVLLTLDTTPGGPAYDPDSPAVATLVTLPRPGGTDRAALLQAAQASLPADRQVPGLMRRSFIIVGDRQHGSLTLWKDMASARNHFDDAWRQRTRTAFGGEAALEWFDTPILLPGRSAAPRSQAPAAGN